MNHQNAFNQAQHDAQLPSSGQKDTSSRDLQLAWRNSAQANLIGLEGQAIVEQPIQPDKKGRVKFKASWWSARCLEPITIPAGELVDIVAVQGITLIVEPTILLKASPSGLAKIQQAWQQKGWTLQAAEPRAKAAIVVLATGNETASNDIAPETWQRFIQGKPIYIKTFKACCKILNLTWQEIVETSAQTVAPTVAPTGVADGAQPTVIDHLLPTIHPNFVGRAQAIADLHQLVQAGAKLITILGPGGLGKTTLARQYLSQQGFDLVLECWMAKETHNLTSAESVVQEWLQRYFSEQPGRQFSVSLERLRQQLRQATVNGRPVKIGVLIDNLEPALDRNGRLIESQRQYAALLEVLTDPHVQSVSLVTSREPLHEVNVTPQPYVLPSLDVTAWREFFNRCRIATTSPALEQMHRAYGGNAKAMTILSSVIRVDCDSCLNTYWREHQSDLLSETSLEALVDSHFTRLQQLYPEAYQLLCRLGCYRYQDIANVPIAGLLALLWDVPETEQRRVIRFLGDLFLVEVGDEGYRLHPTIQARAVELLHRSQEWQLANRQAAQFWQTVPTIATIADALTALEAYHHYVQIGDWEAAAAVILQQRSGDQIENEPLGVSFYRLGLLQPMIAAITQILQRLQSGGTLGHLYRILGDLHWLTGSVHQAIHCHEQAHAIALEHRISDLELVSLFNIGLCRIDLWELDEALQLFNLVNTRAAQTEHHVYAVGSWFCLALLHSHQGNRKAAMDFMEHVSQEFTAISFSSWSRCYSLLFLGLTAKNLDELDNARRLYELAQHFAERSCYPQVKARALSGLAELCRQQSDFQAAIAKLLEAKQLLDQLEARGDLAEVHYQLGLTYYKLNELAASQANFAAAIQLFEQMNAPKQVERVQATRRAVAASSER
ncbi:hypothetical protein HJG54_02020 [Leptolyngbya sp. NK1-12]|uniref:NfeD-like C-terminal domain-containing protein n=2 Tax=Leptolyngbya sp. NK1-12 TaxID=2547451 RepID=A0AA97AJ89_9CYAN|nr:hypothetical protein HJG54_02020 [Leptolyngbya sp. NK1-12]